MDTAKTSIEEESIDLLIAVDSSDINRLAITGDEIK
jgi:hypothetical protein